ncbi:uncharacterized protein JCM6883_003088 [Sporobolomyces salmoneus]|uniref:uncharacterized protein n=1 Tax=Sporobolomyces salmoneus TaxID=183962 RepID=UPI0031759BD6
MPRRSSTASSASTAAAPRRSSRKSITVLPPPSSTASTSSSSKKNAPTKKVVKRVRKSEKIEEESEEEDNDSLSSAEESESDEGETTTTGAKKRKASSSSKSSAKAPKEKKSKPSRVIKPKPRRPFVSGLNALPSLFTPFPLFSSFSGFEIPPLPTPEEAPRSLFVFGTGDMGQHGLGVETLDEIKRPRRHVGVEGKIEAEEEGWEEGVGELACGGMHSLAIDRNGRVWSWGINDNAALGRQTSIPGIDPEELESNLHPVEGLTGQNEEEFKAVRVSAGDSVSLAVSQEGELKAWGSFRSAEGLLGFSDSSSSSKTQLHPTSLKNLEKHSIVQIACGDDHFLALTSTGYVFACGNGEQNQLGRKIIQRHKTHGLTPERLALKKIVLIGTGSYHSFAVSSSGQVYSWGSNSFHQTGHESSNSDVIEVPTIVESLSPEENGGNRVVQIEGGSHHTLFLFSDGSVKGVGRTDGHEVGLSDDHPEMKANEERKEEARERRAEREKEELEKRIDSTTGEVKEISGLTVDEESGEKISKEEAQFQAKETAAKAVELPNDYVLHPTTIVFPREPKTNDPSMKADDFDEETETEETKIVSISVGTRHNFAISSRGYVYSWGVGPSSQLGQGNEEEIETPRRIWNTAMSNVRAVKVETGGQHSVIVGVDREWETKYEERKEKKRVKEQEELERKRKDEQEEMERKRKDEGLPEVKESGSQGEQVEAKESTQGEQPAEEQGEKEKMTE